MVRLAFLGTPEVAVPALGILARRGVDAVFCNPDRPSGRGQKLTPPPVKMTALEWGLPLHQPERWKEPATRELWESLGIDLAVVVAYGHILPEWMMASCPLGVWNLHFSLLPRWRGAAPVNHAVWSGDAEVGVSLMKIEPGLDAGPVLAQCRRAVGMEDTSEGLLSALAHDGAAMLEGHLDELWAGRARPLAQDPASVTYAPKLSREMAAVDWFRSALELHRQVRALNPWPGVEAIARALRSPTTHALAGEERLKLCAVGGIQPSSEAPGTLVWGSEGAWATAGDGRALELLRMQRPGKAVQPALQALQPFGKEGKLRFR